MSSVWQPKLKRYRHFDGLKSPNRLMSYVSDPDRVAKHAFYPLLSYEKSWKQFAPKGMAREPKKRTIKYASRTDAAVFSYYRYKLGILYEDWLRNCHLSDSVLAYRSIPKNSSNGGKGNIDFAKEAFEKMRDFGACSYACLDISKFFDNLDHKAIKRDWADLLGTPTLPDDHFNVYRNLIRYGEVPLDWAYQGLGIKRDIELADGTMRMGFAALAEDIEPQICYPDQFRKHIVENDLILSFKDRGCPERGIPQGVPLSDLLANVYMRSFDEAALEATIALGGYYARYSDDIIVIIPKDEFALMALVEKLTTFLEKLAHPLRFNPSKLESGLVYPEKGNQRIYRLHGKAGGCNYLGFRFDGSKVFLREKTLGNFWRANSRKIRKEAMAAARRYPGKSTAFVRSKINEGRLLEQTGRVQDFSKVKDLYGSWTFWTYAKRADTAFSSFGSGIGHQLRNHRVKVRDRLDKAVNRATALVKNPNWLAKRKKR